MYVRQYWCLVNSFREIGWRGGLEMAWALRTSILQSDDVYGPQNQPRFDQVLWRRQRLDVVTKNSEKWQLLINDRVFPLVVACGSSTTLLSIHLHRARGLIMFACGACELRCRSYFRRDLISPRFPAFSSTP